MENEGGAPSSHMHRTFTLPAADLPDDLTYAATAHKALTGGAQHLGRGLGMVASHARNAAMSLATEAAAGFPSQGETQRRRQVWEGGEGREGCSGSGGRCGVRGGRGEEANGVWAKLSPPIPTALHHLNTPLLLLSGAAASAAGGQAHPPSSPPPLRHSSSSSRQTSGGSSSWRMTRRTRKTMMGAMTTTRTTDPHPGEQGCR